MEDSVGAGGFEPGGPQDPATGYSTTHTGRGVGVSGGLPGREGGCEGTGDGSSYHARVALGHERRQLELWGGGGGGGGGRVVGGNRTASVNQAGGRKWGERVSGRRPLEA